MKQTVEELGTVEEDTYKMCNFCPVIHQRSAGTTTVEAGTAPADGEPSGRARQRRTATSGWPRGYGSSRRRRDTGADCRQHDGAGVARRSSSADLGPRCRRADGHRCRGRRAAAALGGQLCPGHRAGGLPRGASERIASRRALLAATKAGTREGRGRAAHRTQGKSSARSNTVVWYLICLIHKRHFG